MTLVAVTLLGCELPRDRFYAIEKQRICSSTTRPNPPDNRTDLTGCELEASKLDYSSFKACPFCAKNIWQVKEDRVDKGAGYVETTTEGRAVRLEFFTSDPIGNAVTRYFVGHMIGMAEPGLDKNAHLQADIDLASWKEHLKGGMEPLNLWDEDAYGLYTVLCET